LELAGHRRNGDGLVDPLLHEQRGDQVARPQVGLAHQRAERLGAARAARAMPWIAHGRPDSFRLLVPPDGPLPARPSRGARVRPRSARSTAPTSPSIVCGSAVAWTRRPARRASAAVTGPMQTTFGAWPAAAMAGWRRTPPAAFR